ncbi:MAG: GGDEF domain-containing protein [Pelomonas sp.]|nr:GGDEF domain-containing protein [Roseateles sp.]
MKRLSLLARLALLPGLFAAAAWAVPGAAASSAAAPHAGGAPAATLDPEIASIETLAMHDAPAARAALDELAHSAAGLAHPDMIRFGEGLVAFESGDTALAARRADELAALPADAARGLLLRARVAARQARLADAARLAQQSLDAQADACPPDVDVEALVRGCDALAGAQALSLLVADRMNRGSAAEATTLGMRALTLAEAAGDRYNQVTLPGLLAWAALAQERTADVRRWLDQAAARTGDDPLLMAQAKSYESLVAAFSGDKATQQRAINESLLLARRANAPALVARALINLGDAYMHAGQTREAMDVTREALPIIEHYGDVAAQRTLHHNLSILLIQQHRFDAARHEVGFVESLRRGQPDTTRRIRELRELDEAWSAAGQPREAIAAFHAERALTDEANARNRDAQIGELRLKYDIARKQRDLALLRRDQSLKDQQLDNRQLAQRVGIAAGVLLGLATVLGVLMVRRVRAAQAELQANQAQLRAASERDPLTDLANRRHFLAVMERMDGAHFDGALLMVDLDHFKQINDGHGHAAGDVVICEVARRLKAAVRAGDIVVRWGGEEFLVFAPGANPSQLATLAERVLDCIGMDPVQLENGGLKVTASVGFAHFPLPSAAAPGAEPVLHWEQAVNWVDMALFTAKAHGRNRAVGITRVHAADAAEFARIEADFETARNAGQVELMEVAGP